MNRVRFGKEPKCVRGRTVIPGTSVYNVILWDDSCIMGLSAILRDPWFVTLGARDQD